MQKPETIFKQRVLRDLRALPYVWAEKIQQQAIRGTPDILACICGVFVAIELKKDAEARTDKMQDHTLNKIRAAGGRAFVTYPKAWAEHYRELRIFVDQTAEYMQEAPE